VPFSAIYYFFQAICDESHSKAKYVNKQAFILLFIHTYTVILVNKYVCMGK